MADPTTRPGHLDAAAPTADSSGPGPDAAAADTAAAVDPVDVGRRRFFRQFAGELANTAAMAIGAAQALQQTSAELAGAILDPTRLALEDAAPGQSGIDVAATTPVFRTSFRLERNQIRFVDQRALPGRIAEHSSGSAAEVTWAIRHDVVMGGPAIAQAAVTGLALTADRIRTSRPYARRATLRGAANALMNASPTHAALRSAVERAMAAYESVGELSEDGDAIADAFHAAADAVVAEAAADHGRLVDAGLAAVDAMAPRAPGPDPDEKDDAAEAGPLRLLIHGPSGALAGGQFGTALAIAIAAHHAGRAVHVLVPEARPTFVGARVSCWELAGAGVPHTLIADAAGPALIAAGDVDAVLVPADRVASNGDVGATVGTYGLALAAARAHVPFLVCAPATSVDAATPDAAAITIATRPAAELETVNGTSIAPPGTEARVPLHDVTPAELVTGFITGEGLRHPPFGPEA